MPDTLLPPAHATTGPIRLSVNWTEAMPGLDRLGPVRVETTNGVMVHQKEGVFGNVSMMGPALIVLNHHVDLRVFPQHWQQSFYQPASETIRVYDGVGRPIHTIQRIAETDAVAWMQFIAAHTSADQSPLNVGIAPDPADDATADAEIDVAGLRAAWGEMTDVHQFHGMLKRFGAGRLQAMRLAGAEFARPLPLTAVSQLLEAARDGQQQIMIFAGNNGCIQIHTGTVNNLSNHDGTLLIDDPGFRLSCDVAGLAAAWVVFKPTDKGGITTVELYDDKGHNCAILCGQRDEDKPERAEWRALAQALPIIAAAA